MVKAEYPSAYEKFKEFFIQGKWLEDEEYKAMVRQYCVRAIYAFWNQFHEPASYLWIVEWVMRKLMANGIGDKIKRLPTRDTIERRIRETIDPKFWNGNKPPCVRVRERYYAPNPENFSKEEREKMKFHM